MKFLFKCIVVGLVIGFVSGTILSAFRNWNKSLVRQTASEDPSIAFTVPVPVELLDLQGCPTILMDKSFFIDKNETSRTNYIVVAGHVHTVFEGCVDHSDSCFCKRNDLQLGF